jgi:hypothetical protein
LLLLYDLHYDARIHERRGVVSCLLHLPHPLLLLLSLLLSLLLLLFTPFPFILSYSVFITNPYSILFKILLRHNDLYIRWFLWVVNLVCNSEGRTYAEDVRE